VPIIAILSARAGDAIIRVKTSMSERNIMGLLLFCVLPDQ
jgi:hypothetical protein